VIAKIIAETGASGIASRYGVSSAQLMEQEGKTISSLVKKAIVLK
jgi:hypothetical protein